MGMDCEVLPFYFENLYILENPNIGLEEFEQRLNQSTSYENREEYRIAYTLQKELLQLYPQGNSIKKLNRKVKRLVKKEESKY